MASAPADGAVSARAATRAEQAEIMASGAALAASAGCGAGVQAQTLQTSRAELRSRHSPGSRARRVSTDGRFLALCLGDCGRVRLWRARAQLPVPAAAAAAMRCMGCQIHAPCMPPAPLPQCLPPRVMEAGIAITAPALCSCWHVQPRKHPLVTLTAPPSEQTKCAESET